MMIASANAPGPTALRLERLNDEREHEDADHDRRDAVQHVERQTNDRATPARANSWT